MSKTQFEQLIFKFTCLEDPLSKSPINLQFAASDFSEVTGEQAEGLFKQAALDEILKLGEDKSA